MNDPEIQRKIEKGGRGQLRQDIEDEVQNKEHPGPLRTARRGHEPGHQGQSKAMNPASCREQGSDDRQANTGLECMNTGEQSGAEGPRPEQWTGNNDGEEQDKLAGRRKPNSNDKQALPAWFYASTTTETLLKGQPKCRGAGVQNTEAWRGIKGTEGPSSPGPQILTACVFLTWIGVWGCLFPTLSIYWRWNDENAAEFTKLSFIKKKKKKRSQKSVSIPFWGIPLKICFQ